MTYVWFIVAAIAEIAGCFAVWAWVRLDKSSFARSKHEHVLYKFSGNPLISRLDRHHPSRESRESKV